ncbi:hypothetical protein K2173_014178 [Erythroxylum novogranatense]|uniref:Reverse transcriptase n=1 Tax=Erythroxylum novogranatense TaxID=1862640 RepID=A0AAV8SDZ1_9ROSI|nr:hypothetical protein K2173_014178 [Erythroxylum novogranatense]
MGDFNEITYGFEKQGRRIGPVRQMTEFRNALDGCGLIDLGSRGPWFTWETGNTPRTNIRERLDRGVATSSWREIFSNCEINHLSHSFSDHCPLLLDTNLGVTRKRTKFPFRFESSWCMEDDCEEEIRKIWTNCDLDISGKLNAVSEGLTHWSKNTTAAWFKRTKELKRKLDKLNHRDPTSSNLEDLILTKLDLNLEINRKEWKWEQRARENWLSYGDRNTAYFHKIASQRRKMKEIKGLEDQFGSMVNDDSGIEAIATGYFDQLFHSTVSGSPHQILAGIRSVITTEMNTFLLRQYTSEEIFKAIQSMGPTKAAGLGNYPSLTWKSVWSAKALLATGLQWKVGNGRKISIWNDGWLPMPGNNHITKTDVSISASFVADLFIPIERKWDIEKISNLFDSEEATRILSIPLAADEHEDELWP